MEQGTVRLNFNKIRTARATEKNLLVGMFSVIPIVVILFNLGIFSAIYFSGEPIEFNGVLRYPGDPLYVSGFVSLVQWFIAVIAVFLILIAALNVANRPVRHLLAVDDEGNPMVLVRTRRTDTLHTVNAVHAFDRKTRTVFSETVAAGNPVLADDEAFAWFEAKEADSPWTARRRFGRVILEKSADAGYAGFHERIVTTYRIRLNASGTPASAVLTVARRSANRVSVQLVKRFVYQDVGSHVRFDLPSELRAKLDGARLL